MPSLMKVEGIGEVHAKQLAGAGIRSAKALLAQGATPRGRKDIAAKTGLSEALILEWVNRVDLFRIRGVAEEYSDLLEQAGVDTVVELAQRKADNLQAKLAEVNAAHQLVRQLPSARQVGEWIKQAKRLARVVRY